MSMVALGGSSAVSAPFNIEEASIATIHAAIQNKQTTCTEIVDQYLARIEAYDKKGPTLNAVITINPNARQIAAQQDAEFARTGKLAGPLQCIPVAVKDNYNTTDMTTTGGNLLLKNVTPTKESTVTQRLRDAGAIILLKTNLHEFALSGTTVSSLGGQTKNPYDLTRTPGGSSGGTGASVASNFATVGVGTDTVNSIRSPASANSLVGFRSTKGLVSRANVLPVSKTQDVVGPITRSVADAAVMLDVIAGYDPADPVTARAVGHIPASFQDSLNPQGLNGARIGVLKNFVGTQPIHAEVTAAFNKTIEALKAAGATVVEIDDPFFDAGVFNRDYDVQKWEFKPLFNDYLASLGDRAPVKNLGELIASGQYNKPTLEKFLASSEVIDSPYQDKEYLARLAKLDDLRDRLLGHMAAQKLDAVVYPEQMRLVVPITETNQADRTGILAGLTGFPAVTVPMGFSSPDQNAPIGVPMGMDMIGRPFSDPLLVKLAYSFEQATRVRKPPQSTPSLLKPKS
jgi:amidase